MNSSFFPRNIEYMVVYPNGRPDEKVLLIVAKEKGERWLIYAPRVIQRTLEMEQDLTAQEIYDGKGRRIAEYHSVREVILNNEMYVLADETTYFNVISLDKQHKPTVKKEEVEKLFGCHING
jgi:hypothetical protein